MTTNGTTEQPDAAAERAAFFASVAAELQQVVTEALQHGTPTEQLQAQYQAVLERAGERLARQYRIPAAYLPDIIDHDMQIALLLTAISAAAAEQAREHADLLATLEALVQWARNPTLRMVALQIGLTGPDTLIARANDAIASARASEVIA
jgi:hypothetical protein